MRVTARRNDNIDLRYTPYHHNRGEICSSGVRIAMSKLYRHYKGGLERVQCQATSLSAHAAYLLVSPSLQRLCLFLGGNDGRIKADMLRSWTYLFICTTHVRIAGEVGRVDQAKAEALADSVRVRRWCIALAI